MQTIYAADEGYTTETGEVDKKKLDSIAKMVSDGDIDAEMAELIRSTIERKAASGDVVRPSKSVLRTATDKANFHGPVFRANRGAQIACAVQLLVDGDMTLAEVMDITGEPIRTVYNWLTVPESPGSKVRVHIDGVPVKLVREAKDLVEEAAAKSPAARAAASSS